MTSTTESLFASVAKAKKELETAIKTGKATAADTLRLLASYRSASQTLIFHDFAEHAERVEESLWQIHVSVNSAFRERLEPFRAFESRAKVVERRKLEKQYIIFIKASQRFYRGLVHCLASHFTNIAEVLDAAREIKTDALSPDEAVAPDTAQKQLVLQICHYSLVRLGDLSRYRETLLQSVNKDWGPAKRFYRLAIAAMRVSGMPYHQLAVIAQMEQDTHGSLFYFYKALMQQKPHPNARANLEKHFRKVSRFRDYPGDFKMRRGQFAQFACLFVAFHAECFVGAGNDETKNMEDHLIDAIDVPLLQESENRILNEICLINIAAEAYAYERLTSDADEVSLSSYESLQSFNIRFMTQVLRALGTEMQKIAKLVEPPEMEENRNLTPIICCLLSILRQYSSWLLSEIPHLVLVEKQARELKAPSLDFILMKRGCSVQDFWPIYVEILAALAQTYPIRAGRVVNYLLAEDEDCIAFRPFMKDLVQSRYLDEAGNIKPPSTSSGIHKADLADEMFHRVRQIVKDGLAIAKNTEPRRIVPIRLKEGRFIYINPNNRIEHQYRPFSGPRCYY